MTLACCTAGRCMSPALDNGPPVPSNAPFVIYTDDHGQLLDTLQVCQDFNRGLCNRPACKFVHIQDGDGVEVVDQRVAVCRDAATGKCSRSVCKYYHIPIALPPAPIMAALASTLQQSQRHSPNC
ncbi:hypothetical protein PPYR_08273 [Photinus pyralis]|uniref:C3H1-type domain-containing protein n=1 Tax=Photinus pyralis TaxID=7054 RepID=A0A5N4AJ05_PHOPY|nr:zinc finger CCCH domain-containing protein 28-like [Photinus pyralis]KAB0797279.1 hypothetical protein PPYR_08273 [Photinus pyralis]